MDLHFLLDWGQRLLLWIRAPFKVVESLLQTIQSLDVKTFKKKEKEKRKKEKH